MSQWWRAVGNTASDLICPRFEPHTSRSKNECVTARPLKYVQWKIEIFLQRFEIVFNQSSNRPAGWTVMRPSLEWKVWVLNLGPVRDVLPASAMTWNCPCQLVTHFAVIQLVLMKDLIWWKKQSIFIFEQEQLTEHEVNVTSLLSR